MPITLDEYRKAFPETANVSDEALANTLYQKYGGSSGMEKPDFLLALQGRGQRMSPLESGIANLKSSFGTAKAGVAQALGADEAAGRYLKEAQDIEADVRARYQPEVRSYEDIDSPYKLGRYVYEKFGESAPQMGLQVAGAVAGGGIGGLAARGVLGSLAARTAAALGTEGAAIAGSTAAGLPAYTGSNLQRQMEEGTEFKDVSLTRAGGAAAAQSALDTLSLATVFKAIPAPSLAGKANIFTQAVIRGVESGATEALTETAQQALEIAQANPKKLFDFSPEVQKELKEAAVAGALLGGAMGGASGAIQAKFAKEPAAASPPPAPAPAPGPTPDPGPTPAPAPTPLPGTPPAPVVELAPKSFGSEELTTPARQTTDPATGRPIVSVFFPTEDVTANVEFQNDFDRALHFAGSTDVDPVTRQEYRDFLTYQGLTEDQVDDLHGKLEQHIQDKVLNAPGGPQSFEQNPLSVDFVRTEASDVYNNLPMIAKTWGDLKKQGFTPIQINEEMSGEAAHTTSTVGSVPPDIQKETNVYFYSSALPSDLSAAPAIKPDKKFQAKLEAMAPGVTGVITGILQRVLPGRDFHIYDLVLPPSSNTLGRAGPARFYKTARSEAGLPPRSGDVAIGMRLERLAGKLKNFATASPNAKMSMVHTLFHEMSHPVTDLMLTNLTDPEFEEVMQQYYDTRNSVVARRLAMQAIFEKKLQAIGKQVWEFDPTDLRDKALMDGFKSSVAKNYDVTEKEFEKFIADSTKNTLEHGVGKPTAGSYDLSYQRDFQEWVAEVGARWMAEELKGRVPETFMQKFAREVFNNLKQLYYAIEAALGVPHKKGAFEKFMNRTWGKTNDIVFDKPLVDSRLRDPRNTKYYPYSIYNEPLTTPSEGYIGRPEVQVVRRKTSSANLNQLPPAGGLDPILDKLRKETEKPESGIKAFFRSIRDAYKNNSWRDLADNITEKVADNMIKVLRLDERYAEELKKQGRTIEAGYDQRYPMTARLSAYAAALARDNSLAMVETILHHGGKIEFVKSGNEATDGYVRVKREGGGLTFLGDLVRSGKLERWRDYAMAKRIEGLTDRGLKTPITLAEAQTIINEYGKDPDITKAYESYQEHNRNMINLAVDTGVITREAGNMFLANNDYYPFYREMEEGKGFSGPIFTAGIVSPTKIAQAMGGTEHLKNDPVEVILKNTHFWANAAAKNVASNKMYTMMKTLKEATDLPAKGGVVKPGELEGTTRIDGKERRFIIKDPGLAAALESMGASPMPNWTKLPGAFTSLYRELVTRDPTYIFKNLMRDPFSAMVTSGVNFSPFTAIGNFFRALRNPKDMESLLALQNFGIMGGFKSLPNMDSAEKLLGKGFDPKAIQQGSVFVVPNANTLTGIISKSWNALGRMSEASDAATRTAIYDEVLKQTGSEAEAAFRAQEVMNFRKHGTSQGIRILSMMVPFVNGRIQGISVAANAFKPENLPYTMIRGGMLFGAAMALQALTADDKDYQQLPDYVRQGSMVLPLKVLGLADKGFLAIPKPFEMGFVFQTIPEMLIQAYGLDTKEDRAVKTVLFNYMAQTFGFSPFPSVVAPLAELYFNRSSMTGLPIITQSMEHLPPELQYTAATSDTIKSLGQVTGISPAKLETIVKGYGGQVITTMLGMVDGLYRTASGKGVDKDFTQYQPISTFIKNDKNTNPQGVADIYRLSAEIQGLTTGFQNYVSYGMVKEAQDLMENNQGLFAIKQTINGLRNQLNNLSKQERMLMNSEGMSQEARTQGVDSLREARRQITTIMPELIKYTGK